MKLVEIIILAGTQCASPITPGHLASEVSKVPCAVVIERDTETRSVSVQPPALANHPKVRLALAKPVAAPPLAAAIAPSPAPGPQIAATASAPQPLIATPPAVAAEPIADETPQPAAAAQMEEQKVAALPGQSSEPEVTSEAPPPVVEVPPPPVVETAPPDDEPAAVEAQPETPPSAVEKRKPKAKAKAPAPKKIVKKKSSTRVAGLAAKPKSAGQCVSPAKPVWYTNSAGQKKYRCAKPGAKLSLY